MSNYQLMVAKESTYATPVTPTRGFEYNGDAAPIKPVAGRTEGNPLRPGSRARRKDRMTPYFHHAEGTIALDVMDKGFGFWLEHMLGTVGTTGAGPYTHTATDGGAGALMGDSFTAQFNYELSPGYTTQAVTFAGGKVTQWTLANSVEENLTCELECDFASMSTATALATASYPSSMTNLTWMGGVITVGGSAVDVTNVSIAGNQNYDVDRRRIRGNAAKKEPTPGVLEVTASFELDFESLAQWNRVHALTQAGTQASFSGVWTAGTSSLTATIPSLRLDELDLSGETNLMQSVSGIGEYDGTNSVCTLAYVSSDVTP